MATQDKTDEREDHRGEGFPQLLHDRARTAAEELHRLLLSLSTAAVGVFFLALISKADPPLTQIQKASVLIALFAMAGAAFSGIASWYSDCRRNYFWAMALQSDEKKSRTQLYQQRDRWLRWERFTARCLIALFIFGVLASMAYMACRVLGL
jgi:hypothetical protein